MSFTGRKKILKATVKSGREKEFVVYGGLNRNTGNCPKTDDPKYNCFKCKREC